MAFISLRSFSSFCLCRKSRGQEPAAHAREQRMGTAHNQEDPGCRAVAVAALCQGHPDLPGSHQKCHRWSCSFPHHLEEPGQERCVREKVNVGLGWGLGRLSSIQPCSTGVPALQPCSPFPLLMQQLFQENPCPHHSPLQQSSVLARPADPLEQLQSDPDSHQQHIPQL